MPASGPRCRVGSVASTSRKHTRSKRDEPSGMTEYYDLTEDGDEQSQPAPTQSQAGQPGSKRARSTVDSKTSPSAKSPASVPATARPAVLPGSGLRHLLDSSFGRFYQALQGVDFDVSGELGLPRIVVTGEVSVGKTTLVEAMTKMTMFPRKAEDCTRHPVRVKLQQIQEASRNCVTIRHQSLGPTPLSISKDQVCARVQAIMDKSGRNTIVESEIVIEVHQEDVPTLELIDLPGVRASPPAAAKASRELVQKYLADPKTMVLLVVPATDGSLNNSAVMEMVVSANRQSRTILALTKSDGVHSDLVDEHLTRRILGTATDLPPGQSFFGCVAVTNRTHRDVESIDTAAAGERGKFDVKFGRSLEALTAQDRAKVKTNTTVSQLIKRVDELFHQDICTVWKPWALQKLDPKLQNAKAEQSALGVPVSRLSAQVVMQGVVDQVNHDAIGKIIIEYAIGVPAPAGGWGPSCSAVGTTPLLQLSNILPYNQWGTAAWAKVAHEAHHQAQKAIEQAFNGSREVQAPVLAAILPQVAATFTSDSSLKLQRFSALKSKLLEAVMPAVYQEACEACEQDIVQATSHARTEQSRRIPSTQPTPYCALAESIAGCLRQELMVRLSDVKDLLAKAGPAQAWMREDDSVKLRRANIQAKCDSIVNAKKTIQSIDSKIKK